MWILFALGSALFAGATSILAKVGIQNVNSHLATAIRTAVVLVFSWLMVWITGSAFNGISTKTLIFLVLSGMTTGASWICYFRALQIGDVNKVVPIDKSSTILTMALAFIILGEPITWQGLLCMVAIGAGTLLMIQKKEGQAASVQGTKWLWYAIGSAVFASLTSILGKVGIEGIDSNLGTAIRTIVVLIMAWVIVFWQGTQREMHQINRKSWVFLLLSGIATGLSWLCYYRALQMGPASVVVPIDKLSILVTVAFAYIAFKEKLTWKAAIGLALIVAGTLGLILAA